MAHLDGVRQQMPRRLAARPGTIRRANCSPLSRLGGVPRSSGFGACRADRPERHASEFASSIGHARAAASSIGHARLVDARKGAWAAWEERALKRLCHLPARIEALQPGSRLALPPKVDVYDTKREA